MRHSQTTIANGIPIIDLHPSNERRDGGVVRAWDEHLPRFSDGEAPGEEAEAEEARRRQGRQSRKSRGSPPCSTSHVWRCEEELGEAGSNVRRSSGRRAAAAMVKQLVPLLDIFHAAARGGAWGGGRQRPWWSGDSLARSPVGRQPRRRRAATRPPLEPRRRKRAREREEAQRQWVSVERHR
jgi:hypothetical protein